MQIIEKQNGIQSISRFGKLTIDPEDPNPTYRVVWDTDQDGAIPGNLNLETQLGGFVRQGTPPTLVFETSKKDTHDAAIAAEEEVEATRTLNVLKEFINSDPLTGKVLKAMSLVLLDEINLLRQRANMSERTFSQFKQAIDTKLEA